MSENWIAEIQEELRRFAAERNWEKFHTPQNLAALIASEAGELLALFRWGQNSVDSRKQDVEQELADILLGLVRFADVADIDLRAAAQNKLDLNAKNYPSASGLEPDRPRRNEEG